MHLRRLSSIPAPESAPVSRARLAELSSEIVEIQRAMPSTIRGSRSRSHEDEGVPSTMPTSGWSGMARVLVETAVHHVVVRELDAAHRAAHDALLLVDLVESESESESESDTFGELSLVLGEVLLEVFEAERARQRFEAAIAVFERRGDVRGVARGRVGLARAMAAVRDPVACAVLEDAGTVFEDLGEEELVRAIDLELREVSAELGPASFRAPWSKR